MKCWYKKGKLVVVCDPGIDDLLALRLLERLRPGCNAGIEPVFGNMPKKVTLRNARAYAAMSDYEWNVLHSEDRRPRPGVWIDKAQGRDGLWNTTEGMKLAPTASMNNDAPTEDSIISLGTLGPVMRRMQQSGTGRILIMGGVFERISENGNDAELNIRLNPGDARWVFDNADKADIWLVPADVAFGTAWTRSDVESIPELSDVDSWLKQVMLRNYESGRYKDENELYDPIAVLLGFCPQLATWERIGVRVDDIGRTLFDESKPPVWIATDIPDRKQLADILFTLLFKEKL